MGRSARKMSVTTATQKALYQEYAQGIKWAKKPMQLHPQEAGERSERKWQLKCDVTELKFTRMVGRALGEKIQAKSTA